MTGITFTSEDQAFMTHALALAERASQLGEVPVGAVVVFNGQIIGSGFNLREQRQQVTAHAEIVALEEASKVLQSWRLDQCDLYITLEPCAMCAGAIQQAHIRNVIFGARDPKAGVLISTDKYFMRKGLNHYPAIKEGLYQEASTHLLKSFFRALRKAKS